MTFALATILFIALITGACGAEFDGGTAAIACACIAGLVALEIAEALIGAAG